MAKIDSSWDTLYKVGGISFIIIGIWYGVSTFFPYLFGIPAPGFSTPPIVTEQQYFDILSAYPTAATIFYVMYSISALLCIPALLALYVLLKDINKNAMLVAMGFVALWVVVEIGITEFNSLTLISLIQHYNGTTDTTMRAAYLAAAYYALGVIPIATFYSYFLGSLGFLIASFIMRRTFFRRGTALPGIASNALGIVAAFVLFIPELSSILLPTLNLYALWNILVGAQLFKIGKRRSQAFIPPLN